MKGELLERIIDKNYRNIPWRKHIEFCTATDEVAKKMKCSPDRLSRTLHDAEVELDLYGVAVYHKIGDDGYVHFKITDVKGYFLY